MDVDFLKHKFEDSYYGVIVKKKFKLGVRHIQVVYMFVCALLFGMLRGSVGIAVTAASDKTRINDTYIQIHNWDNGVQGFVISSFFFGYALLLLPMELFLKKWKNSSKLFISGALLMNGSLCLAMPTIVNRGGWIALSNAYLLMGMTQTCLSPCNQALLKAWLPPNEKEVVSGLVYYGVHFGVIISLPLVGKLAETPLGWELIYYSLGMLLISFFILWTFLTSSLPDDHQAVGDMEKEYIKECLETYRQKAVTKPWMEILHSVQFWSITSVHASCSAIAMFYLVELPVYLTAFGDTLFKNAVKSIFPHIALWLVYVVTAPTVDWIIKSDILSYVINVSCYRKLINALGAFGVIIGLSVWGTMDIDSEYMSSLIIIGVALSLGFQLCGFLENFHDISENFSGTLLTLSSTIASFIGALVPLCCGFIVRDHKNLKQWSFVILSLASFSVFSNIIYSVLANSERQIWDYVGRSGKKKLGYALVINDDSQTELIHLKKHQLTIKQNYKGSL